MDEIDMNKCPHCNTPVILLKLNFAKSAGHLLEKAK